MICGPVGSLDRTLLHAAPATVTCRLILLDDCINTKPCQPSLLALELRGASTHVVRRDTALSVTTVTLEYLYAFGRVIVRRPQRTGELQSMAMFEIEHWQPGLRCARTGRVTRLITQPVSGDL